MKEMSAAAMRRALLSNLLPKKSGIVFELRCFVMTRVLLPRMIHARREPMTAFPIPIHVDATPYFQPNCPAYPMNTTAEK